MMNVSIGAAWLGDRTELRSRMSMLRDLVSHVAYSVLSVAFI
jgi:hypothetical protein